METVRTQKPDEVKATLIWHGNEQLPLGEFFDVSGSAADDESIVWYGDCSRVKLIGTHLGSGRIHVEGNAGMHLGAEMTGGEITVSGNAGDWLGAEMHGGSIQVHGSAGHLVGGVYRGGRRGMTGGEILIDGDVGNEMGRAMRRGLIAVAGRAGDAPGLDMIAGSILLFGQAGIRAGAGMRRGTIGMFSSQNVPELLSTFKLDCVYRPVFLQFYLRHLKSRGFPVSGELLDAQYRRYSGDFVAGGKGEILVIDNSQ